MISASLREEVASPALKEALVYSFHKKPLLDPIDLVSFQLVSKLSFVKKVVEKRVTPQFQGILEEVVYLFYLRNSQINFTHPIKSGGSDCCGFPEVGNYTWWTQDVGHSLPWHPPYETFSSSKVRSTPFLFIFQKSPQDLTMTLGLGVPRNWEDFVVAPLLM